MSATPGPEDPLELMRVERAVLDRAPEDDIVPTLDRVAALVDLLGSPQRSYPVVHLTGTNGKTSTARMTERLLRGFGLRTGMFTSPHLHSMTERIALDGVPIGPARFVGAYDEIAPFVELVDSRSAVRMSFFEVLTGMAYAAFADAPVEVAVVEVGLGGAWDATNVADGQVAVLTPIALDHTRYLGADVAAIAREKAGIVKPGAIAVSAVQTPEAGEVLAARAAEVGARLVREGVDFGVVSSRLAVGGQLLSLQGIAGRYDDVFLPLLGSYQARNAACALAAVEAFFGGGSGRIDPDVVRAAFADASSPGRLEVLRRSPTVLVDAAHNPAGALATATAIEEAFSFTRLVGVLAVLDDKDARGILEAFEPLLAEVVLTQTSSPRALDADALGAVAVEVFGADRVEVVPRLVDALDAAVALAEEDGGLSGAGVLVTGSVTTVAEARVLLGRS